MRAEYRRLAPLSARAVKSSEPAIAMSNAQGRAGALMSSLQGADGASATALQPPPHLLTTLPAPAGGGRCGCHGTAAHGRRPRGGAEPLPRESDLGERPGLGQSGVGRAGRARRRTAGARRRRVRRPKPAAARPTGLSTSSGPRGPRRPARPRAWNGQRASRPSSPSSQRGSRAGRYRRSPRCAERRRRSRFPTSGAARESTTPSSMQQGSASIDEVPRCARRVRRAGRRRGERCRSPSTCRRGSGRVPGVELGQRAHASRRRGAARGGRNQ